MQVFGLLLPPEYLVSDGKPQSLNGMLINLIFVLLRAILRYCAPPNNEAVVTFEGYYCLILQRRMQAKGAGSNALLHASRIVFILRNAGPTWDGRGEMKYLNCCDWYTIHNEKAACRIEGHIGAKMTSY